MGLNKMRIALSLAGIAVGITSVIITVALGDGSRARTVAELASFGSNVLTVDAGKVNIVIGRRRETSKVTTLKEKDAEAIVERCGSVSMVAPTQDMMVQAIKYQNGSTGTRVIGTTPDFPLIRNYAICSGRFFDGEDSRSARRVAVIGQKIVIYLFRERPPLGEIIRINGMPFEIIGVLSPKGMSYDGANEDDVIFIPLRTGMRRLFNVDFIKNIYVRAVDKGSMIRAEEEIRGVLRERHRLETRTKEDDFTIQDVSTARSAEQGANELFTTLINGVAALSLAVGGVGILAMMILSVRERKAEIGLRMAVGAKPRDILVQFLLEAILLSLGGGGVGILVGVIVAVALGAATSIPAQVSFVSVAGSVALSMAIGIFFGAYPAWKASHLQPGRALKD